eukprot:5636906-Karenia_brevis.AAC.1
MPVLYRAFALLLTLLSCPTLCALSLAWATLLLRVPVALLFPPVSSRPRSLVTLGVLALSPALHRCLVCCLTKLRLVAMTAVFVADFAFCLFEAMQQGGTCVSLCLKHPLLMPPADAADVINKSVA